MAVKQIPNLPAATFVSPTAQIEIVQNGVSMRASASQIGSMGTGATIEVTNDITDTSTFYPMYLRVSSGSTNIVYASNPNYTYIPSEGRLSALRTESKQGISFNSNTITQNYTFPTGDNGLSAGPVDVQATITVPTGSAWTVV